MICFIFLIRKLLKQTNSLKYEVKDKEKSKKKLIKEKKAGAAETGCMLADAGALNIGVK